MKWLTFRIQRSPGFRLNLIDLIFIGLLTGLSGWLYANIGNSLWGYPLYLGLSFFCFCNLFRIGNRLERFWYIPFTMIAGFCIYRQENEFFWTWGILILELLKWMLIGYRIIHGPYYGIGYKLLNKSSQPKGDQLD